MRIGQTPRFKFEAGNTRMWTWSPWFTHGLVSMPVQFFADNFPECEIDSSGKVHGMRVTDTHNGAAMNAIVYELRDEY